MSQERPPGPLRPEGPVSPYLRFEECPSVLTKEEAAAILRIGVSTLEEWIARDRHAVKCGHTLPNPLPFVNEDRTERRLLPSWLLREWVERECCRADSRLPSVCHLTQLQRVKGGRS